MWSGLKTAVRKTQASLLMVYACGVLMVGTLMEPIIHKGIHDEDF